MIKFKIGDKVVVKQDTTPGGDDFHEWVAKMIASQEELTIKYEKGYLYFEEVGWILHRSNVELSGVTLENE